MHRLKHATASLCDVGRWAQSVKYAVPTTALRCKVSPLCVAHNLTVPSRDVVA